MRRALGVVLFDVVVTVLLYYVLQDLSYRSSYAQSEGLAYSVTYYPFIRVSHITGNVQFTLTSPPALDWVQVIIAVIVVVNGYYLASLIRERRANAARPAADSSS